MADLRPCPYHSTLANGMKLFGPRHPTLVERSSLGTPEAAALRATVSDERAAQIVARAKELEDAGEHDCATCTDCIHDGRRCCGCCDGACCKEDAGERVKLSEDEREALVVALLEPDHSCAHNFAPLYTAVERILAGRLAAVAALVSRTEERLDHSEDRVLRFWARELSAAVADPASVLAQRDAEVGAKALEEARKRVMGPSDDLRDASTCRSIANELDDQIRGLPQGVDR